MTRGYSIKIQFVNQWILWGLLSLIGIPLNLLEQPASNVLLLESSLSTPSKMPALKHVLFRIPSPGGIGDETVDEFLDQIYDLALEIGFEEDQAGQIKQVATEIIDNMRKHSMINSERELRVIQQINRERNPGMILIGKNDGVISNLGDDIFDLTVADPFGPLENLPTGGWGLPWVRHFSDKVVVTSGNRMIQVSKGQEGVVQAKAALKGMTQVSVEIWKHSPMPGIVVNQTLQMSL